MKTKLIFLYPAWQDSSEKYYIFFHKNKIHKYKGVHPLSNQYGLEEKKDSEILINSFFDVIKLDKIDRLEHNTKATHEIRSQELHNSVDGVFPYCVKLNFFQVTYINWFQKKYIVQSLDLKKTVLSGFIGVVLGSLVTLAFQKINIKNNPKTIIPKKEIKHKIEPKEIKKVVLYIDKMFANNGLV